jgi:hypothetical protein
MNEVLWIFAVILTIATGIIGIGALIYVFGLAAGAAATAFGFIIGSFLMLVITTVADIRFISLVAIIFTMLADQYEGGWAWIALITSFSLFLMSAAYLLMFLTELFFLDESVLEMLAPDEQKKKFLSQLSTQITLNLGFLGIIYIFFSFFATSYNYFLVSSNSKWLTNVFTGPQDVVYSDFLRFSLQTILDSLPFDFSTKFNISVSPIGVEQNAYAFKAYILIFQCLFYSAIVSLFGWITKGRKLLNA